jgi:hypothetical protein
MKANVEVSPVAVREQVPGETAFTIAARFKKPTTAKVALKRYEGAIISNE